MRYSLASAAALFLLAGCGEQKPVDTTPRNEAVPTPVFGATLSPTAGAIELQPLKPDDAAELKGELACSFARGKDETLLIGRANVGDEEQSAAVVRIGDRVEELVASVPGGFGAMERGLAFGGNGLTMTIERHEKEPTGNESSAYGATLVAQRGDGAEQSIAGRWICGP